MSDDLEPVGDKKSTSETPSDNRSTHERQPDQKKDSRFTLKQFFEFGGIAGIFIVWAEVLDCKEIGGLIAYGIALILLYLLPAHFIYELCKKRFIWVPIVIWLMSSVATSLFVFIKAHSIKPETESRQPIVAVVTQPDFIEGTKFTKNKSRRCFRLGMRLYTLRNIR